MPQLDPPPQPSPRFETAYLLAAVIVWTGVLIGLVMPPAPAADLAAAAVTRCAALELSR